MAWRKVLAMGVVASGVALGCSVTSTSDTGDGSVGTGGMGGSSTGGGGTTSTGGTTTSTGGTTTSAGGTTTSTGGTTTSTGGTGTGGSTGFTCAPNSYDGGATCQKCVETKCCTQWQACGTDPYCAGTNDGGTDGEIAKFQQCMLLAYTTNGGTLTNNDKLNCAASSAAVGGVLSQATQDLVTCITVNQGDASASTDCEQECYNTVIGP